jgi:hypothetical protein
MVSQEEQEQFRAWKEEEVTQIFFRRLLRLREDLKECWAQGDFSAAFDVEMAVKNAGATGACSAYKDLLEIDAEDLFGDSND